MFACFDVHYRDNDATASALLFANWSDDKALHEVSVNVTGVAPYQAGQFFRRELPCLLAAWRALPRQPQMAVIDGYVWLSDDTHAGLGAYFYEALGQQIPVIGVAKRKFASAQVDYELLRGQSATPLYITAAGLPVALAAQYIGQMHGAFRLPTLLKRVDQLCRGTV